MKEAFKEVYRRLRNFIIKSIRNIFLICPIKEDKIIFDNFSGRGYGDNPKYISEEIIRQKLLWDIVWLTYDVNKEFPEGVRPVKYGSIAAMYELATAKIWVDNVRATLKPKKRKGQVYLQTWHSSGGVKKLEAENKDILEKQYVKNAKLDGSICDAILSSSWSQYEKMKNHFWLSEGTEILKYGSPRNDILFDCEHQILIKKAIRKQYNISMLDGVVLYMPTFRDNGSNEGYKVDFERMLEAFESKFRKKFVVLVRLHPNVLKQSSLIEYSERVINATYYPDAQELYAAADFLISDYSSAPFDFSLLRKPVFLCTLDRKDYVRGLSPVFERLPFSVSDTNEQLISTIYSFNEQQYWSDFEKFMKTEWISYDEGNAAFKTVNWIKNKMNKV